ncbi:uncharacterized protein LOC34619083 [Cyclospora cayetanensis]|uniref:Uncharacterized protein LOC34619083 n=1 Tax=Cyclospora cayetanensis TaxID=88456 RepID=A0A6P6RQF6_9EIME|nr:uncharacterized protein LOC34619083 [Cyclospora cayetanensis]
MRTMLSRFLRQAQLGVLKLLVPHFSLIAIALILELVRGNPIHKQIFPFIGKPSEFSLERLDKGLLASVGHDESVSLLEARVGEAAEPQNNGVSEGPEQHETQTHSVNGSCEDIFKKFEEDFNANKHQFNTMLETMKNDHSLEEKSCLKTVVHPEGSFLNDPELSTVKSSVELHFGAIWMWDKIARILLKSRIPPPLGIGDTVKLLQDGSTIMMRGEYTVTGVQNDEVSIEKEGERLTVPRDRLILTIQDRHVMIADKVLRNEIKNLNEDDPSLLEDMEEVFRLAGITEAFRKTQRTNDPRHLQSAMRASELFHCTELPGIEARQIQKPSKRIYKPDPSELSSIYTARAAVQAYELLQLIRGYTALEGCRPLTHKSLYGTANELVFRMIENARFEVLDMEGQDILYAVLENQCRTTAAFTFPGNRPEWTTVIPKCLKVWEQARRDWSQLGQVAPGYLEGCDERCMKKVLGRNFWFDKSRVKRRSIGKDFIIAGDALRFAMYYAAETLPYLDLVGGQTWRLGRIFDNVAPVLADIGKEADLLLCLGDLLTTEAGQTVQRAPGMTGFGLPHPQLLALYTATDLRHHASIAGGNLKNSKKLRKAAKGSMSFTAFFKVLSCHINDDAEALHKVFGPFASLAIRIALFLRIEIEEQGRSGWKDAVKVFSVGSFDKKLYRKVVQRMTHNAGKFITKFMEGFGYEITGKIRKIKKRIKELFKRKPKANAETAKVQHSVGHSFAKLILLMWVSGSKHQLTSTTNRSDTFYNARLYQALTILNHGVDPMELITKDIKHECKRTKNVAHKYWALLRKSSTISRLADELGAAMAYGFLHGQSYSKLSDAGRSLGPACRGQTSLDLLQNDAEYLQIVQLYQCMELQRQAVAVLKLALGKIRMPPADIIRRLFSFLKQIRAIRKEGAKGLFEAYLRWVKEGEASTEVNKWNDSIEMFECSWHSSQSEQDAMVPKPNKSDEEAPVSDLALQDVGTCAGKASTYLQAAFSSHVHYSATLLKLFVRAIYCAVLVSYGISFAATANAELDLQQGQVDAVSSSILHSTML